MAGGGVRYNRRFSSRNLPSPVFYRPTGLWLPRPTRDCFLPMEKRLLQHPPYRWLPVSATNCKVPRGRARLADGMWKPRKVYSPGNPPRQHKAWNRAICGCLIAIRSVPRYCLPDEAERRRLYGTTQGKRHSDTWGRHNRALSGWSPICVTYLEISGPRCAVDTR